LGLRQQAEGHGYLHGINICLINICLKATIISHILFADDCFLFSRTNENEAQTMKQILMTYEATFRQAPSLSKLKYFVVEMCNS